MITASPPRKARSCARRAPAPRLPRLLRRSSGDVAGGAHGPRDRRRSARCATARGRRSHACVQSQRTRSPGGRRARPHKAERPHGRASSRSHPATLRLLPTCEDGAPRSRSPARPCTAPTAANPAVKRRASRLSRPRARSCSAPRRQRDRTAKRAAQPARNACTQKACPKRSAAKAKRLARRPAKKCCGDESEPAAS